MVEILCPHCEGEIELDDDASGEFECPLCNGEFEWNVDETENLQQLIFDKSDDLTITTDFKEMPAVPKVAGIAFSIYMGLVIFTGLWGIIGGLMISSVEAEFGTGTEFGALIIVYALFIVAIGITGLIFGIRTAKVDYVSLIVITCISGLMFLLQIMSYESAQDLFPIFIALVFTVGNLCCLFVPILKAQFTGVLVTRNPEPNSGSRIKNEFDKTKPIHPFEWAGHGLSLFMLIIIIFCLSSSSWYTVSIEDEDVFGVDLNDDLFSMGLSEVKFQIFGQTEEATYSELVDDSEYVYEVQCIESSSSNCDDLQENLDFWKSWKTSTLILKIILITILVVAIIGIISRIAAILSNTGLMNLPDKGYFVNDMIRKFSSIITSTLMFIGVIIFMIMQPGVGPEGALGFNNDEIGGSFGGIVWIALITSVIVPILSKFEIDYS